MRRRVLLGLLFVLAGCGSSPAPVAPTPAPAPPAATAVFKRYVALGDSYTAAPYVPKTDGAMGCIRSSGNYPHLLAKAVKMGQLVDVSCSGATTHDLASPMPLFEGGTLPPQDKALTRSTDLVTLGIGGNDNGLFATILSTCRKADGCGISAELPELSATVDRLGPTLVATLHRVRVRAPKAKILLIGYPKIAPDEGGCAQLPQLAAANLGTINEVNLQLNNVMRAAARTARVGFINVYKASRGHDICSPSPWVNGTTTDTSAALALHPFAREQAAVARLIQNRITR